jgi:hypothetical protein
MRIAILGPDGTNNIDDLSFDNYQVMKRVATLICKKYPVFDFQVLGEAWACYIPLDIAKDFPKSKIFAYTRAPMQPNYIPGTDQAQIFFSSGFEQSERLNKTFWEFRRIAKVEGVAQLWVYEPWFIKHAFEMEFLSHIDLMIVFPTASATIMKLVAAYKGDKIIVNGNQMELVSLLTPEEELRIFTNWQKSLEVTPIERSKFLAARKSGKITGSLLRLLKKQVVNEK